MTPSRRTRAVLGLIALGLLPVGASSGARAPDVAALARARAPESAPVRVQDGAPVLGANDLARLLGATKFWRADLRKLVLRMRGHRIQLTADNPFVLIDDRTVLLPGPVRSVGGELHAPVALVDSLPRDSLGVRLRYDPARRIVFQVPPGGVIGQPRAVSVGEETRLVFPVDGPGEAWVTSRSRAHFRIHFAAFFVGVLVDSFAAPSLARNIRRLPSVMGTAFELELAPEAAGYRIESAPDAGSVTLVLARRADEGLEEFAPEGPPGPPALRVVVLDPGHGGPDAGVTAGETTEKQLTLALARALEVEIERRVPVRVVLTRADDRGLTLEQRAEIANRARADLVLSLHFDGFTGGAARGATAWCAPALASGAGAEAGRGIVLRSWRDVPIRHAVASREVAEDILSALDLGGHGPTRLREVLPSPLLGVNAPGLMLECGTLTSESDRARLLAPGGLVELAARITDGIETWRRRE